MESAAYDGMPNSADEAGIVDFQLKPEELHIKMMEVTKAMKNGNVPDKQNVKQETGQYSLGEKKAETEIFQKNMLKII